MTDHNHIPPAAETIANMVGDAVARLSGEFDAEVATAAATPTGPPAQRRRKTRDDGNRRVESSRPQCFKQVCTEPVAKVFNPQPGVFVKACAEHVDDADTLARTGRC